jgi:transcriptional regulator with XRE-family HTH domain
VQIYDGNRLIITAAMDDRRKLTPDEQKILGENLRAAREDRARIPRNKDAAAKIGVAPTQVSLWELGRRSIDLPRLLDVAAAYGVPLDDLVVGLNPGYDALIEQKLPLNVRRHMHARIDAVMLRDVEMAERLVDSLTAPAQTAEPSAAAPPVQPQTPVGKSAPTRARRKIPRKKKTRRRRDADSPS